MALVVGQTLLWQLVVGTGVPWPAGRAAGVLRGHASSTAHGPQVVERALPGELTG